MLASTDGLPGPLMLNRFGSPGTMRPRNVTGAVGPHVAQGDSPGTDRVDPGQRPGQRVESGGKDQHIAGIGRLAGPYSVGGDRLDRLTAQVHQPDVVAIESGVIARVRANPL